MSYAELFAKSNFSFLTGASHAEELILQASELGLDAIAITDKNTFAGVVRGYAAAKELGVKYIIGVELVFRDNVSILAYPKTRQGYGNLCRLLTIGKRRAAKGECHLDLADLLEWGDECMLIIAVGGTAKAGRVLGERFPDQVYIGMAPYYDGEDENRFAVCAAQAKRLGLPIVALGNVLMHHAQRRRLADILSCIREKTSIDKLGRLAQPNAERRLKSEFEIRRVFKDYPEALQNSMSIATSCEFSLEQLQYEYPDEVTDGLPPNERLRQLTESGLKNRYPDGCSLKVRAMVEKELTLINELNYARYFLTVYDIVAFARSKNILCQGRGSAANSVVCYALGITEASPEIISMVFERFISAARNEPPDIDVDFEHERREEVIQHIYQKYGRHRAGICSTVIHFRSRAAIHTCRSMLVVL